MTKLSRYGIVVCISLGNTSNKGSTGCNCELTKDVPTRENTPKVYEKEKTTIIPAFQMNEH